MGVRHRQVGLGTVEMRRYLFSGSHNVSFLTIRLPLETEERRMKLGPKEGGRGS